MSQIGDHTGTDAIPTLVRWGEAHDGVRAMLITSTRAVPGAHVDRLSDYDVILVLSEVTPFVDDRGWLEDFGETLVVYWDPLQPDPDFGLFVSGNVTQYVSGLKIDFSLWPVALLRAVAAAPELPAELDAGYRVLLDKDGLAESLAPPTYTAYIPKKPSREEYGTHINDFLTDAPYVAKCLWRDQLFPAKWCLDHDMKHVYLRPVLEWRVEIDHDWSLPVGALGKGLKAHLPPDLWAEVEGAYAGAGIAENWDALARTLAVFRRVATEVGTALGYTYHDDLHRRVLDYVATIKQLPPPV